MKTTMQYTLFFAMATGTLFVASPAPAQLLSNLEAFPERTKVGDPGVQAADGIEGPKGIATADLDRDQRPDLAVSNLDGTVTVLRSIGNGEFASAVHLQTDSKSLRGIIATDLNGDGSPDLATAAPLDGQLFVFWNDGNGNFGAPTTLPAWKGVRNLAAGDFDGDGVLDLAAAGPENGLRHYRGKGSGEFEVMGDLPHLAPLVSNFPKPVYTLETIRAPDGTRDDLVVMHADSERTWILSTQRAPLESEGIDPSHQRLPSDGVPTGDTPLIITEFMATSGGRLVDEDGDAPGWIELCNRSAAPVNLEGWKLITDAGGWTFPALTLDPGHFLLVFASGKDRAVAGRELHANFTLSTEVPVLRLLRPGVGEIAHEHDAIPASLRGVSQGVNFAGLLRFYDQPSAGSQNNGGVRSPVDLRVIDLAQLSISPPAPPEDEKFRVRIRIRDSSLSVQYVWFPHHKGTRVRHRLMKRVESGSYVVELSPEEFDLDGRYQVIARVFDSGSGWSELTLASSDQSFENFAEPKEGALRVERSIPSQSARSFAIGSLLTPSDSGVVDLVTANRDTGLLNIHRGNDRGSRFDHPVAQSISVPGGPRAVKIVDYDGDGWNDLIVVLRNFDRAIIYRNEEGKLVAQSEMSTGVSPREIAVADFTSDGHPDAAVINRVSSDLSILETRPDQSGFVSLDQIYPTSADVSGLSIVDYNQDGRDDVVQLHRASWEYTVRLSEPDGSLGPPEFFSLQGGVPGAQIVEDVNNDGVLDLVTANLEGGGSVSVRLGDGLGDFGEESIYRLPPEQGGRLFALVAADFDKDGNVDLAAGYFDCRISFFRGTGDGKFTFTRTTAFVYESRIMRAADLDQDGDLDIVGVGARGDFVVVENPYEEGGSSLLTGGERKVVLTGQHVSTARFEVALLDGDDDPDLVVGSTSGVSVYHGTEGVGFRFVERLPGFDDRFPISAVVTADFDGNGTMDTAAACAIASCVAISTQDSNGKWAVGTRVDVPSGRHLATGDLDGDGQPDLVGVGDVLWTALSSRRTEVSEPVDDESRRTYLGTPVINELLAINNDLPLEQEGGKATDWVELYLPKGGSLESWKLELERAGEELQSFDIPAGVTADEKGHTLIYFSTVKRTGLHTGFKLPGAGATLRLLNSAGEVVDAVTYPAQQENVSYGRYEDAHPAFTYDAIPSPGRSNFDNGAVEPVLKFEGFARDSLSGGQPVRVFVEGKDDVGIETLVLTYTRVDQPGSEPVSVILFDDGLHEDGEMTDGLFSGLIEPALPAGAEIQFHLEATDLSGKVVVTPGSPDQVREGEPIETWSLALAPPPGLEIYQVVGDNVSGPADEAGGTPDYLTVRNRESGPVSLDGVMLARSFVADADAVFRFPSGIELDPGETVLIFADATPEQGPMHAPFTIDRGGERIVLMSETAAGSRILVDQVDTVRLGVDEAFTRLEDTGYWIVGSPDLSAPWQGTGYDGAGSEMGLFVFSTEPGYSYQPEYSKAKSPEDWRPLPSLIGDGGVQVIDFPVSFEFTFRVQAAPAPAELPEAEVTLGVVGRDSAEVVISPSGFGGGVPEVIVYYGDSNGKVDPTTWKHSLEMGPQGERFSAVLEGLTPASNYYLSVRVSNSAGASWADVPGATFTTRAADMAVVSQLSTTGIGTNQARLRGVISSGSEPVITVFFGQEDAGSDPNLWERALGVAPGAGGGDYQFEAMLDGLEAEARYFYRMRVENAAGTAWTARVGTVETRSPLEMLRESLVISELMFHPGIDEEDWMAGFGSDDFEFIEFYNRGPVEIDLRSVSISSGIRFSFADAERTTIEPGEFLLLVRNINAFEFRYGTGHPIAGQWMDPFNYSRLADGGETLVINSTLGQLERFQYRDDWVNDADGDGESLVRVDVDGASDSSDGDEWVGSFAGGGSPGEHDRFTYATWLARHFSKGELAEEALAGLDADPDQDGVGNFEEYAFDGDPRVSDRRSLAAKTGTVLHIRERYLTLDFPLQLRASDLDYHLEASENLADWEEFGVMKLTERGVSFDRAATVRFYTETLSSGRALRRCVVRSLRGTPEATHGFLRVRMVKRDKAD